MRFPIIKNSLVWLIVGGLLMIASWLMFFFNFQLSIEFTGGIDMKILPVSGDTRSLEKDLEIALFSGGYKDAKVKTYTNDDATNMLITLTMYDDADAKKASDIIKSTLLVKKHITTDADILSQAVNGPSISDYMKQMTGIAIIVGLFGIVIYMFFSFASIRRVIPPTPLALMTIATMIFDISIPAGFYGLRMMINPTIQVDSIFVIALLTIMGYSINDTIIVFDRIRENAKKYEDGLARGSVLYLTIFEDSVRQTMRRSIATSLSTFLAVVAMYIFGTDVIQRFSYTMAIGVLVGTFSSIFISAPAAYMLLGYAHKELVKLAKKSQKKS